jgi:hypothetical protein
LEISDFSFQLGDLILFMTDLLVKLSEFLLPDFISSFMFVVLMSSRVQVIDQSQVVFFLFLQLLFEADSFACVGIDLLF